MEARIEALGERCCRYEMNANERFRRTEQRLTEIQKLLQDRRNRQTPNRDRRRRHAHSRRGRQDSLDSDWRNEEVLEESFGKIETWKTTMKETVMRDTTLMERKNKAWVDVGQEEEEREMRKTMELEKKNASWAFDGFGLESPNKRTEPNRKSQPIRSNASYGNRGTGQLDSNWNTNWNEPVNEIKANQLSSRGDTQAEAGTCGDGPSTTFKIGEASGRNQSRVEGRRLTQNELQDRMKRGVGFKGEEKWDPGGSYVASCITWSLHFKQWDPGKLNITLRTR